ncbi:MAG: peptidase S16, partial [Chromatiales bacterium]|nr:peptidase S16 [Chromatiales bacterium]
MDPMNDLPIFALNTVLCPEGQLPLRVFETRYVDMIKRCMASASPFGVCLIRDGNEVGQAAAIYDVGTLANVVDFDLLEDGLLGITAKGGERFRITDTTVRDDQLLTANCIAVAAEPCAALPDEFEHLAKMAEAVLRH